MEARDHLIAAQARSERARKALKEAERELEAALKAEREADAAALREQLKRELGR